MADSDCIIVHEQVVVPDAVAVKETVSVPAIVQNRGGFLISNGEIWKNVRKIVYGLSLQTNYRRPSVGRMFNSVPSMTNIS